MDHIEITCQSQQNRLDRIISNFQLMKEKELFCDYEIHTEKNNHCVHKFMLAACSRYFEKLFLIDNTQQSCNFEGDFADGIDYCITYMYTGNSRIPLDDIRKALRAAKLIGIDGFTEDCLYSMLKSLDTQNCMLCIQVFKEYDRSEDVVLAEKFLVHNLQTITSNEEFSKLSLKEVETILNSEELDAECHWHIVSSWCAKIKENSAAKALIEKSLDKILLSEEILTMRLCAEIWSNPYTNLTENFQLSLANRVAQIDLDKSTKQLDVRACLTLLNMTNSIQISNAEAVRQIISVFLLQNLENALKEDIFCEISFADLNDIIKRTCQDETTKWEAIIKWVKHDSSRKEKLCGLMQTIDFNHISLNYIKYRVKTEQLVAEDIDCLKILLDALNRKIDRRNVDFVNKPDSNCNKVCVLTMEVFTGQIMALEIPTAKKTFIGKFDHVNRSDIASFTRITSVAGKPYVIQGKTIFEFITDNQTWREKCTMEHNGSVVVFLETIYLIAQHSMLGYDPKDDSTTRGLPGCELGFGFSTTACDNCIYAIGGISTETTARIFDPESNIKWIDLPRMPRGRIGSSATVYRMKLYVIGGFDQSQSQTVDCFDPTVNSWFGIADLNRARERCISFAWQDKIYVVGGDHKERNTSSRKDSIEAYTGSTDQWNTLAIFEDSRSVSLGCLCFIKNVIRKGKS